MSATSTTWQWPADLIEYATRKGVVALLEPLREMTQRLFPTTTELKVFKEDDPEIRDLTFIVFRVHVPAKDVPDFIEANHRWGEELFKIYLPPCLIPFVLSLRLDE